MLSCLSLPPDVTPPQISVVGGKTQYEIEVHLDFEYPQITATDSSGETAGITRLNDFDKSERAAQPLSVLIWRWQNPYNILFNFSLSINSHFSEARSPDDPLAGTGPVWQHGARYDHRRCGGRVAAGDYP